MTEPQRPRNLQELVDSVPNLVDYLFRNPKGALFRFISYAMPSPHVSPEFTNWRDEQRSWWESVGLSDQSFHMTNLWVRGPDAFRFLEHLAVNSFQGYVPGRAKQFIACSPDGYFIGDAVLYYLAPETFVLVGVDTTMNWVQYHAEAGGYRVTVERDPLFSENPTGRRTLYRFELEGPKAELLMENLVGGPLPEIRFFHFTTLSIAGRPVWVLRHSMTGSPGFELSGPWEDRERVLQAILEAGKEFGLRRVVRAHREVRPRLHRPRGLGAACGAASPSEGDPGVERGGRVGTHAAESAGGGDAGEVPGSPREHVRPMEVRPGGGRTGESHRDLAVDGVRGERASGALVGDGGCRVCGARDGGGGDLGRGRRGGAERAMDRAARAHGGAGDGRSGARQPRGPGVLGGGEEPTLTEGSCSPILNSGCRSGPGGRGKVDDWQLAVLITVAVPADGNVLFWLLRHRGRHLAKTREDYQRWRARLDSDPRLKHAVRSFI
jgi:hypothetical protein